MNRLIGPILVGATTLVVSFGFGYDLAPNAITFIFLSGAVAIASGIAGVSEHTLRGGDARVAFARFLASWLYPIGMTIAAARLWSPWALAGLIGISAGVFLELRRVAGKESDESSSNRRESDPRYVFVAIVSMTLASLGAVLIYWETPDWGADYFYTPIFLFLVIAGAAPAWLSLLFKPFLATWRFVLFVIFGWSTTAFVVSELSTIEPPAPLMVAGVGIMVVGITAQYQLRAWFNDESPTQSDAPGGDLIERV